MLFAELYGSKLDEELGTADSTSLFTTARRKKAINDGLRDFADLTECYVKTSTISCSNGVGEYNLLSTVNVPDGDYVRLAGRQSPEYQLTNTTSSDVTYVSGEDFERRDVVWLNAHEPGWRDSTGGTPEYHYLRPDGGAFYFGMYPPPEISTAESAKVVLPYVAKPSSMTDDTHAPFQSSAAIRTDLLPFHQALVHFAAHQLEKLRRDDQASDRQLQKYVGYVQRYVQSLRVKGGATIRTVRSYFGRETRQQDIRDPYRWP